ncbi:hypothetical protein EDC04DRAFT_636350 [Pisolithus marmoratus]|nr:hypothetical protein EDC04DRAFT_636350 [Pisolithus marmoratus]
MENVAERQVPDGCEMWIWRSHKVSGWSRKKGATMGDLVVFWVDHRYRRVLNDAPTDDRALPGEDDRLDDEYRIEAGGRGCTYTGLTRIGCSPIRNRLSHLLARKNVRNC